MSSPAMSPRTRNSSLGELSQPLSLALDFFDHDTLVAKLEDVSIMANKFDQKWRLPHQEAVKRAYDSRGTQKLVALFIVLNCK